jgi:hypothetical protein
MHGARLAVVFAALLANASAGIIPSRQVDSTEPCATVAGIVEEFAAAGGELYAFEPFDLPLTNTCRIRIPRYFCLNGVGMP